MSMIINQPSVRYSSIEPCNLPSGGCTYVFTLEVIPANAKSVMLRQRYSAFRVAALAVQARQPLKAAELPPFPPKFSMSRQTPTFLVKRGRALARYVQALLADATLAAVPEVQALLSDAKSATQEPTAGSPLSPVTQAQAAMHVFGTPQSSVFATPATVTASPPMRSPPSFQVEPLATAPVDFPTSTVVTQTPTQLQVLPRTGCIPPHPFSQVRPPRTRVRQSPPLVVCITERVSRSLQPNLAAFPRGCVVSASPPSRSATCGTLSPRSSSRYSSASSAGRCHAPTNDALWCCLPFCCSCRVQCVAVAWRVRCVPRVRLHEDAAPAD